MRDSYIKLAVLGVALLGLYGLATPFAYASTLKTNSASGIYIPFDSTHTGFWMGVGYGSDFATGTVAGVQIWTDGQNATTTQTFQLCMYEYQASSTLGLTAQQMFETIPYKTSSPTGNSTCHAGGVVGVDQNGFVHIPISFNIIADRYYAVDFEQTSNSSPFVQDTVIKNIVGTQTALGSDKLYTTNPNSSPFYFFSPNATYYLLYSGNQPVYTTFDPRTFLPSVATSTIAQYCNTQYATTSNIFDATGQAVTNGLCQVGVFLFVPTQDSLNQFAGFTTSFQTKIPFSYFYDIVNEINALTASSSTNIPTYTVDLRSTGIGSSTALGNILPSQMDILSSSTVNKYLPTGVHDSLFFLAESAIWFTVGMFFYREAKRLFKTTT